MPFVPAPNIVMLEWRCTRNAQNIENRVMIDMLAAPTAPAMSDVAVECWNWWENVHSLHLSDTVFLREVVATDMSQLNGAQVTYAPDTTTKGQLPGAALPNECSFCVSLRSGSRGRSARGRFYTCSVNQAQMADNNSLTSGAVGNFVADLNTLRSTLATAGTPIVIVSYRSNNAPRPGGPVYFVVSTATAVDATIDSMKRRKPGVGS